MSKILFLAFFAIPLAQLRAQEKPTAIQQAVQQTVRNLFESLSRRDSISLKNNCTADVLFFEYGKIWNVDTLINKAITKNTAPDFKRINSFEFINTTVEGNTAWVSYHIKSDFTQNGKQSFVQWLETVVLVKDKKRWKLKVLHSTLIKRG